MELMTWDDDLATKATNWATACEYKYPDSSVDTAYVGIGMNLFKTAEGAEFDLSLAIEKWIGQRNDYTYDSNVCGKECRHYKQMVWATTENIGCALHLCPTLTIPGLSLIHI